MGDGLTFSRAEIPVHLGLGATVVRQGTVTLHPEVDGVVRTVDLSTGEAVVNPAARGRPRTRPARPPCCSSRPERAAGTAPA